MTDSPRAVASSAGTIWFVLRVLATAFYVSDTAISTTTGGNDALIIAMGAAAILLCWFPTVGAWANGLLLAAAIPVSAHGFDVDVLPLGPIILVPVLRGRWLAVALAWQYLMAIAIGFAHPTASTQDPTWPVFSRITIVLLATFLGMAIRGFQEQHRKGQRRIAELETENLQIRSEERSALARELHDVVAHQLSIISLQIMGHRDSDDPEELRGALDRVDDAARSALGELQLLVQVLRDDRPDADHLERLAEVSQPTVVLPEVAEALTDNGFLVTIQADEGLDRLERSHQLTLVRILQEATTNILRHAPDGSPVLIEVGLDEAAVHVRVVSRLAGSDSRGLLADHSMGYGLRGLRERVMLTGGTIALGPQGDEWVVSATLPRSASHHHTARGDR